jgi:hypothetical protein
VSNKGKVPVNLIFLHQAGKDLKCTAPLKVSKTED